MLQMLTPRRAVILNELKSGLKHWAQLRLAYYGEERAKSRANTSFQNQINNMLEIGWIRKSVDNLYEITAEGTKLLQEVSDVSVFQRPTTKQMQDVCKHPIVDAYGVCISCRRKL